MTHVSDFSALHKSQSLDEEAKALLLKVEASIARLDISKLPVVEFIPIQTYIPLPTASRNSVEQSLEEDDFSDLQYVNDSRDLTLSKLQELCTTYIIKDYTALKVAKFLDAYSEIKIADVRDKNNKVSKNFLEKCALMIYERVEEENGTVVYDNLEEYVGSCIYLSCNITLVDTKFEENFFIDKVSRFTNCPFDTVNALLQYIRHNSSADFPDIVLLRAQEVDKSLFKELDEYQAYFSSKRKLLLPVSLAVCYEYAKDYKENKEWNPQTLFFNKCLYKLDDVYRKSYLAVML